MVIWRRIGADKNFGLDEDDVIETMLVSINQDVRGGAGFDIAIENLEYYIKLAKKQWKEKDLPPWAPDTGWATKT